MRKNKTYQEKILNEHFWYFCFDDLAANCLSKIRRHNKKLQKCDFSNKISLGKKSQERGGLKKIMKLLLNEPIKAVRKKIWGECRFDEYIYIYFDFIWNVAGFIHFALD